LFFLPAHNAIDIGDTNNGRRLERIPLPDPLPATPPLDGFAMAFDPSGPALYVLTQAGLSVIHLPALPLSLGSLQPASGSAAGGDMVKILGTGFEPGTSVSLNGSPVAATVDSTTELHIVTPTLPAGSVAITVSTPEGQHYTWADAFAVH